MGLPEPIRQYPFAHPRRFAADFAYPDHKLLIECEGGGPRGHHQNAEGYGKDCEKYNLAAIGGWSVLRATGKQIRDGLAVRWVEEWFERRGLGPKNPA